MSESEIEMIQGLCQNNSVLWSTHAVERLQLRGIKRDDVLHAISVGKIIEQYLDDHPYPSCLVLGIDLHEQILHIVCGSNGNVVKIITAYHPTEDKFDKTGEFRKEKTS